MIDQEPSRTVHLVTGAFGYSGRHLAAKLLAAGEQVITLTGHPDRVDPFGGAVRAMPFHFDDREALARSLRGVSVLYNTYWVRFDHGDATYDRAVKNTMTLIAAAADAGVERFVHVSITNPSPDSTLPYFNGKARLEAALEASGLSYAVLRPTVLFGGRDVLINNIAWLLRRIPVFGVPGDGQYGIQPVHVDDLAELALELGRKREDVVVDAVGPETFSYLELVRLIARAVGSRALILKMPRWAVLAASKVFGWILHDVVLTPDEVDGLSANLLVSHKEPTGSTRFTEWLAEHADELGRVYASELARHYRASSGAAGSAPASPALADERIAR